MSQPLEWLLVEWPENEAEPTKYWLSSLPENIKLASLVDWTKLHKGCVSLHRKVAAVSLRNVQSGKREVRFQTKPQIALDQIHAALADGIAPGVVLADAAYGYSGELRAALAAAGLTYVRNARLGAAIGSDAQLSGRYSR